MKAKLRVVFLFYYHFLALLLSSSLAQDTPVVLVYPPINRVNEKIIAAVSPSGSMFKYTYELRSASTSEQDIWTLDIPLASRLQMPTAPDSWRVKHGQIAPGIQGISWWASDSVFFVRPGSSLNGLSYESAGLPAIKQYYASGWVNPPNVEIEPDSVVGGDLLENAKSGNTVAPSDPSTPFVALDFLDTIISYKHQARDLGWIDNQGIANSLDAKLDNAKSHLTNGNETAARNQLQAFVNEVEAQKDKHLTSETYALLKYNAEYLIDRLPAPPEFPIPDLPAALTISSANASAAFSGDNFTISGKNYKADGTLANDGNDRHGVVTTTASARTGFLNGLQTYQRDNVNGSGGSKADIVQQALAFDIAAFIDTVLANVDQTVPVNVAGTFGSLSNPLIIHATQGIQSSGNITGAGILLVEGPLFVSGTINWTGLVIQRNSPVSGPATSVSTSLTITGGMLVYNTGSWGASVQVSNQLIIRASQEVLENLRLGLAE